MNGRPPFAPATATMSIESCPSDSQTPPATFPNLMTDVLRDFLDDFAIVYLDDILIFSRTLEEHKRHVRLVLERLRANGLFAKPEKCSFHQSEIEYLGFIV